MRPTSRRSQFVKPFINWISRTEDGFQKFFCARRASHPQDGRSQARLNQQLECQEWTALALQRNQFRRNRNPLSVFRKAEGVTIRELLNCNYGCPELGQKGFLANT